LVEAVARPLLTTALALAVARDQNNDLIDVARPLPLNELLERLATVEDVTSFDLSRRAISRATRNAGGHDGVTLRPGGIIELEDGDGNVTLLDSSELEFDQFMLRSILVGLEAAVAIFPKAFPGLTPKLGPLVRHSVASFESTIRSAFHVLGMGKISSMNWSDGGQSLTIKTVERLSPDLVQHAILCVVGAAQPTTVPRQIRVEAVRRPRIVGRKRDRTKKHGGRRRKGR
jgi:hypothetical protein